MRRGVALLVTATVALAACGSDPADAPSAVVSGDSTPSSVAGTSDRPPADTQADADGDEVAPFPVTIEHKFGATTIDEEPHRVVSVGFNEHDFLLALGVVPVGLRDWFGDQPNGVWPWAQDELGDAEPEVLSSGELNFEQIAALDPDLIVGVWSGITEQDYELLSGIAPTVAQPDTYADYGTPWQEQTRILGTATGRAEQAEQIVDDLEQRFAATRADHPEWEGQTASVAFVTEDGPGAYSSQDTRSRIMADLGFTIPDVNDAGGADAFFLELSPEDLSALDVGVLVWVIGSEEETDRIIEGLPTRTSLDAYREGREVFADLELTGAFSHGSPLSLDYALERLVPEVRAAADGDPSTPVPSAVVVGAAAVEDGSATGSAADAAGAAWSTVFDSEVPYDDKAPFLEDAAALRSTIEAFTAAGSGFGGISLQPTEVVVDGDQATVTYDVDFGGNPAYTGQTGSLRLVEGVWTVGRDEFCSFMASARVPCG